MSRSTPEPEDRLAVDWLLFVAVCVMLGVAVLVAKPWETW